MRGNSYGWPKGHRLAGSFLFTKTSIPMKQSTIKTATVVIGGIILFLVVGNASIVESHYRCDGAWTGTSQGGDPSTTVYMKLQEYRWLMALRSESDGSVTVEIPNEWGEYFGVVERVGDQLQIYKHGSVPELRGAFSTLSNTLAIDMQEPFG